LRNIPATRSTYFGATNGNIHYNLDSRGQSIICSEWKRKCVNLTVETNILPLSKWLLPMTW